MPSRVGASPTLAGRSAVPKGSSPFVFASVGDLHVREDDAGAYRDRFAKVAKEARALVLCGDLTNTGTTRQAEILAEDLRRARFPSSACSAITITRAGTPSRSGTSSFLRACIC